MFFLKTNQIIFFLRSYSRPSRTLRPKLADLYQRRLAQGPEPFRHRSEWHPWNLEAEIHAFKNRIQFPLNEEKLKACFFDSTFAVKTAIQDNKKLSFEGTKTVEQMIFKGFKKYFEKMPNEWIQVYVKNYASDDHLAYIGSYLGLNDLILYHPMTSPPNNKMIATSLLAVLQSCVEYKEILYVEEFVSNYILKTLSIEDLVEDRNLPHSFISDPQEYFKNVSDARKIDYRLINQSAMNSMLATYLVGTYVNEELYAKGFGETIEIAVEESAKESVFKFVGISDYKLPGFVRTVEHH